MTFSALRAICALVFSVLLCACAASIRVAPAQLAPLAAPAPDLLVTSDVPVELATGYTRTIPANSRWRAVGTLPQGTVYRPVDTVFAIEGRNVHEAYLVVRSGALHGFYLPGEGNFSALSPLLSLPSTTGAQR